MSQKTMRKSSGKEDDKTETRPASN